jgi:ABC-type multidrug transport system ATPase subunit
MILNIYPWDRIWFFINNNKFIGIKKARTVDLKNSSKSAATNEKEKISPVVEYTALENGQVEELPRAAVTSSLTWTNLSVILPASGKKLVDNVSGFVSSGRVLALMGPSGAGKTTLLNGLARRANYAKITGEVRFAGRLMTAADLTYVPQFDELNMILTVNEHMQLVGRLTCSDQIEMSQRAEKLLNVLGLANKKDVRLAKLSGGEIKRISVGIGMISNPNVLFLDGIYLYLNLIMKTYNSLL